ncbi:MAG: DUF58 domain-containing protein [Endomicrobiaceae bacterium]|jgi:uncharacterized protein (DUF58 family)|nr:DUF58 domain-containing protein [Endomicrobiaceae bacterium]MDD4165816.1 DUF58 domain-containing protein [Endomicrobiaceae bacterium]
MAMLKSEILSKIKKIELRSKKLVDDVFSGKYHSVFKGQGLEFSEVREYVPGDDVRRISWNVTARRNKPYIKKYDEEREQTVMFVVDLSASGQFGSVNTTKNELTAELTSVLAFSALKNNDKAGLLAFTDIIEQYIQPKKNKKHILRLIDVILSYKPRNKHTNIENALIYLNKLCKRKSLVFLISDFQDKNFDRLIKATANKHDLVCIKISDPKEQSIPKNGIFALQDAETGKLINIDFSSKEVQKEYYKNLKLHNDYLDEIFKTAKLDVIDISTDKPYIPELIKFFKAREIKVLKKY